MVLLSNSIKFHLVQIRTTLSDFAVLVGILSATLVDFLFELDTPKLNVPEKFEVGEVCEIFDKCYLLLLDNSHRYHRIYVMILSV